MSVLSSVNSTCATPEDRREALMPFVWNVIAKKGQLYGNANAGSEVKVTNGRNFSYPGYNEIFTGAADSRIDSNNKVPNANVTVLEWLNHLDGFQDRVAAFGSWDVYPYILNRPRSKLPIVAGWERLRGERPTDEEQMLNRLIARNTSNLARQLLRFIHVQRGARIPQAASSSHVIHRHG